MNTSWTLTTLCRLCSDFNFKLQLYHEGMSIQYCKPPTTIPQPFAVWLNSPHYIAAHSGINLNATRSVVLFLHLHLFHVASWEIYTSLAWGAAALSSPAYAKSEVRVSFFFFLECKTSNQHPFQYTATAC